MATHKLAIDEPDLLDLDAPVQRFRFEAPNRRLDLVADGWTLPDQMSFPYLAFRQLPEHTGRLPRVIFEQCEPPLKGKHVVMKWLKAVEPPSDIGMPATIDEVEDESEDEKQRGGLCVAWSDGSSDTSQEDDHDREDNDAKEINEAKETIPCATLANDTVSEALDPEPATSNTTTASAEYTPRKATISGKVQQLEASSSEPSITQDSNTPPSLAASTATPMAVLTPTPAPQPKMKIDHHAAFIHLNPFGQRSQPQGTDLVALE